MKTLEKAKAKFKEIVLKKGLLKENITIKARILSSKEAIGSPERKDFPLLKGKEFMMEADFRGSKGQAYTDEPGNFQGSLEDVINLSLKSNYERAVFISTINAVLRYLNLIDRTRHCKNEEPEICAIKILSYIKERYGNPKILQIGFQPAMVEILSKNFNFRVIDMDPDNINKIKYGVLVEPPDTTDEAIKWADLLLVTGTTATNGTIDKFILPKTIFYGVTIAGLSYLLNLKRVCFEAK